MTRGFSVQVSASKEVRVFLRELAPLLGKVIEREDRGNGTYRNAGATVDAFDGVDVQHLGIRELSLILFRMNAIDGAGVYARRVFGTDARFRNNVCHMFWKLQKYHTPLHAGKYLRDLPKRVSGHSLRVALWVSCQAI
jgi:hypothetical protein